MGDIVLKTIIDNIMNELMLFL